MKCLSGKRILLGVAGGIAAYKSAELVRLLRAAGATVRVVMTAAATGFVTSRTFQALSGEPVLTGWSDDRSGMGHIELARWADRILIAPATADTLARLAQGRADDLLAALCLASEKPLAVAPAMNRAMWQHPATQQNIRSLADRGVAIWGPDAGEQACGETGPGRMLEAAALARLLADAFATGELAGVRVLVTAGPTREAVDPVRFLGNRSSGKMGYALAQAARDAGASVRLVSGPVALPAPEGVALCRVESAQQMLESVLGQVDRCDLLICAAAVADYRPAKVSCEKIKKGGGDWSLQLEPTPDILATVAAREKRPVCVGFAAETGRLEHHAHKKRMAKGVDMIAANLVGDGFGFDSDDNELLLVWEGGQHRLEKDSKARLARQMIAQIAALYGERFSGRISAEYHAKHSA
jgi:phosphopantothenoylcysteine decarboxylase/phosphopantothenate--cysteine ligase